MKLLNSTLTKIAVLMTVFGALNTGASAMNIPLTPHQKFDIILNIVQNHVQSNSAYLAKVGGFAENQGVEVLENSAAIAKSKSFVDALFIKAESDFAIRRSIEFRHLDHANIYINTDPNTAYKNFINAVRQTLQHENPGIPLNRDHFPTIYVNEYAL